MDITKTFSYQFSTHIEFSSRVTEHYYMYRCLPYRSPNIEILKENYIIDPSQNIMLGVDSFNNQIIYGHTLFLHDYFSYSSNGIVRKNSQFINEELQEVFLYPSLLTFYDQKMQSFALEGISRDMDTYSKVKHIVNKVYNYMEYCPNFTNINTSAKDVFYTPKGVCQDYAHLCIALLKSIGIAARYASGLVIGEGKTHAWIEYYNQNHWQAVDPTSNNIDDFFDFIKIAHGRDYSDCPIEKGFFKGIANQTVDISVIMKEI